MGLALLPWERLPAYVLGPLLCALNVWLFLSEEKHTFFSWCWRGLGVAIGLGLIWFKYRKDTASIEPRDKDHTHKDIRLGDE